MEFWNYETKELRNYETGELWSHLNNLNEGVENKNAPSD